MQGWRLSGVPRYREENTGEDRGAPGEGEGEERERRWARERSGVPTRGVIPSPPGAERGKGARLP